MSVVLLSVFNIFPTIGELPSGGSLYCTTVHMIGARTDFRVAHDTTTLVRHIHDDSLFRATVLLLNDVAASNSSLYRRTS